jgi:uncharacterized protein
MAEAADGWNAGEDAPDRPMAPVVPVAPGERISTLDFIRGLAVMGILAANIVAFGQPFEAYMYPAAFIGETGDPGGWLWLAQFVLVDGKMRGLFTLLFGAGLYLFMERAWASGATRKLQAWRLVLLMLFGMVHFFFVWAGDILFYYGLFGLFALACVRWPVKRQFAVGMTAYLFGAVVYFLLLSMPFLIADTGFGESAGFAESRERFLAGVDDSLARGAVPSAAIAAGDYGALVAFRITEQWSEPLNNALLFGFETLPLMLIGMALYRMGFFSGGIDPVRMRRWGWTGLLVGAGGYLAAGLVVRAYGFSFYATMAGFAAWTPVPQLLMVLGMAALLVVYSPAATGWLGERVSAAGRAAFTNYLGTSLVMSVVFHGWGLGLFGQLNRPQLYIVVVCAWVLMLAWSKPWLDHFRYGPLEWLWRCMTYRTIFPLRR